MIYLLNSLHSESDFESHVYIYEEGSTPDLFVSQKTMEKFIVLSYGVTDPVLSVWEQIIQKKWILKFSMIIYTFC